MPVPPEVEEESVRLPPEQMVPPPEVEIVGSATTVTVCTFETGSLQPDPVQFLTTLYHRVAVSAPVLYVLDVAPEMFEKGPPLPAVETCHW